MERLDTAVAADALARAREAARAADRRGVRMLAIDDGGYPELLRALEDPPPVLFTLGAEELLSRASVAIVGTREATAYGVRITRMLAAGASRAGIAVVSGLARGVDAHAHAAALDGDGGTIAVLGTGVDVPYPRENLELYRRIEEAGLVVSEALPGARAHPGSFPRRNRIIAALADLVLVTEAGVKSGALITAGVAGALGRMHAAVPGPVDMPTSAGSNLLLRDGGQVVTSVADLIGLADLTTRGRLRSRPVGQRSESIANGAELSTEEGLVLALLRRGPRLPDELIAASGLAPAALAGALATLTLWGLADVDPGGVVRSTAPPV
ncbi:MAG: DNA-processing protein DprA [Gemmatimonadaceae bacterium]